MEDSESINDNNSDLGSRSSNGENAKYKASAIDSGSKKSLPSTSKKSSSSQLKPQKTTHIYKNDKSLKKIPVFNEVKDVVVLYLHNNAITKIENLSKLVNLTQLYLQHNNIKTIENLSALKNLSKLYLSHNEINVVENLEGLEKLTELHIAKQNIPSGDDFVIDPKCMDSLRLTITFLNISGNHLTDLDGIIRMQNLTTLIAKNNNIKDLKGTAHNLSRLNNLNEVHLSGNPICKMPHYKETIMAKCRNIEIIDTTSLTEETKNFVNHLENKRTSLLNLKEEKEKSNPSKSKVTLVNNNRKIESPNAHLMQLEAKRLAATRSRELRLKQLDCSKGQIPRCFWRNVASERVKEYIINQVPDPQMDNNNLLTHIWP